MNFDIAGHNCLSSLIRAYLTARVFNSVSVQPNFTVYYTILYTLEEAIIFRIFIGYHDILANFWVSVRPFCTYFVLKLYFASIDSKIPLNPKIPYDMSFLIWNLGFQKERVLYEGITRDIVVEATTNDTLV
jgi:hypothetical protein